MLKHSDNHDDETSTVSQDAVDRLRKLTDAGVGADLSSNIPRRAGQRSDSHSAQRKLAPSTVVCGTLVALVLGVSVLWPTTANMAKSQITMLSGTNSLAIFQGTYAERAREVATVAKSPNNATLQFGGALRGSVPEMVRSGTISSQERAAQLRKVTTKFPDHPEILAATLRAESQADVIVHRADASRFLETKPAAKTGTVAVKQKVSDAAAVRRFIDQCLDGERIDPDNAVFPVLRAMAHAELREDQAAFVAMQKAAKKKVWREYIPEEFNANISVNRAVYGRPTGLIAEMAISAAILFPHYANLRELSRVIVAEAMRREQKGQFSEGLALRRDLFDVSEKIRNESTTLIGSLVGSSMMELSMTRPGGALPEKAKQNGNAGVTEEESKRVRDANRQRFIEFTKAHGQADFGQRVQQVTKVGDTIRDIGRRAVDRGIYGMQSITWLAMGQGAGLILLSNMLWLLIIGAIASAVTRSPRFVAGSRLPPGPFVASVAGITLAMVVSGALTGMSVGYTISAVSGLTGEAGSILPVAAISAALVLALPTLITIILAIWAAVNKRLSFTRTITGGFAKSAMPIATILSIGWLGVVFYCAQLDSSGMAELIEMLQHEGKYLFRIIGEKWPVP